MTKSRYGALFLLSWLTLTVLSTTQASADGAYFNQHSDAQSGDQRVFIIKNGDQISMTFSTGYTGSGEEFAWIIPSPVPLAIEDIRETGEIGLNLFKLLDYATAPRTILGPTKNWGPIETPVVTMYRTLPLEHCEVGVLGIAGALPVLEWLRENGYELDPAAKRVLDSYAQENWCFVAVKLKPRENRHYENEVLPPITVGYRSDRLVFPLRITSVSTTQIAKITLYVIAQSTVSAANLRTTPLVQGRIADLDASHEMDRRPGTEDLGTQVQRWIGDTAAAGDLVVVWKGECQHPAVLEELMEDPFPPGTNIFLTRLEARMEPAAIAEDIELALDTPPEPLQVVLRDLRTSEARVAPTPVEAPPPAAGKVPDLSGVTAIAAGYSHALALKQDGRVWAWGENGHGELGDGSTMNRSAPIPVPQLSGVVAIAAGGASRFGHTVALKADGTVWAWGMNYYGELGDGTRTDRVLPVQVKDLSDVTAIAAGGGHTLALKSDGTVWAWGGNGNGRLGDGSTTNRFQPVRVLHLSGIMGIAAGLWHSVALKTDGTVWTWGYNFEGQLGDGTRTDRFAPVQVLDLSDVTAIAAGNLQTLALKQNGTVWAWGRNNIGQLGDGTRTDRFAPVQVLDLSDVTAIAAGAGHTVALKVDGTVWAWGLQR